jgi:hypothetical protein
MRELLFLSLAKISWRILASNVAYLPDDAADEQLARGSSSRSLSTHQNIKRGENDERVTK